MKMHGCNDNDVMVFKLVEALRGPAPEYYNSLPAEIRSQLSTLCTLFEGRFVSSTGASGDNKEQPEYHYSNGR